MADTSQKNGMMEVQTAHALDPDTIIVTEGSMDDGDTGEVSEDILQQALEEAGKALDQSAEEYSESDAVAVQEIVNSVAPEVTLVNVGDGSQVVSGYENATFSVVGEVTANDNLTLPSNIRRVLMTSDGQIAQPLQEVADVPQQMNLQIEESPSDESGLIATIQPENNMSAITIVQTDELNIEPLGSSLNPIRIIQQGNQYTPMQQLTTEQLQQIMQVVQQQHVAKTTQEGGGSILYNPQTNTKIVYRVIYPSELHKSGSEGQLNLSKGQQTVLISHPSRRPYRKRTGDEEEKIDCPDLSKEEKEERKKHRPRTRSGRVSKPPKHMVKDYKHIHVLDWDEDYDDSDGGYSDYKYSEEELEQTAEMMEMDDEKYVHPGLGATRPKNFKCGTCGKAYIGRAGLGRHYRLYPSHGKLEDHPETEGSAEISEKNGMNEHLSEDSNTQDSTSSSRSLYRMRHRRPGRPRVLYPGPENALKRRTRLKEIIKQCGDEELMEIVLPHLAKVITLWEFLLMKVERGRPLKPHVDDVYREFEALHKQVQKMCKEYLSLTTDTEIQDGSPDVDKLQIDNAAVAQSLGLQTGAYKMKQTYLQDDKSFQYKLLTTDSTLLQGISPNNVKRTVEVVSQRQIVTPNKRPRYSIAVSSPSSVHQPPSQVTPVVSRSEDNIPIPQSSLRLLNHNPSVKTVSFPLNNHVRISDTSTLSSAASTALLVPPQPTFVTVTMQQQSNPVRVEQNQFAVNASPQRTGIEQQISTIASVQQLNQVPADMPETNICNDQELVSIVKPGVLKSESTKTISITGHNNQQACGVDMPMVESVNVCIQPKNESLMTLGSQNDEVSNHIETEQTSNMIITENGSVQIIGISGDVSSQGAIKVGGDESTTMVQLADSEIISGDQIEGIEVAEGQIITDTNIFQTSDGIIIIQNPDGSTVQLQGGDGQPIPLETVQALLAMDSEGHLLQESEVQQL